MKSRRTIQPGRMYRRAAPRFASLRGEVGELEVGPEFRGGVAFTSFRIFYDGNIIPCHDTRALQAYLGHRSIQHTVRYTELSSDRFKDFWR